MSALTDLFTDIANAIRNKTGSSAQIQATQFAAEINKISGGSSVVTFAFSSNVVINNITVPELVGKTNFIAVRVQTAQATQTSGSRATLLRYMGEQHENWAIRLVSGAFYYSLTSGVGITFDSTTGAITTDANVSGDWIGVGW